MIRRFKENDANKICRLVEKTLRTVNVKDESEDFIEEAVKSFTPEILIERCDFMHFYVVCEDEKIIGCGAIAPYFDKIDESGIFTVFVLPEYQGKGIGKKIIKTLEKDEFFLRAKRVEVPSSKTASSFFRKMGYDYKNGINEINKENVCILEKYR